MSYETPVAPSLLDLIGRSWTLPGAVTEAVFNRDGSAVAFAGGGRLAVAAIADPERPETRLRRAADTGRQSILPRKNPVRPAAEADGLAGPVAPWGAKSFITGGARGGLVSATPRAQAVAIAAPLDGAPTALARDPSSAAVAVGDASGFLILPDDVVDAPQRHDLGRAATALAYAPDGLLAVGDAGGVTLWVDGMVVQSLPLDDAPAAMAWSPDGAWLAVGFDAGMALIRPANGFVDLNPDYPTPVASFGWSRLAGAFATSGAFRAIAWALTPDGLGDPVDAGRGGLVVVERVAASPDRPLLAVGYANGLVCVSKFGAREEMLLRPSGGAITALAWSADGSHLAFGDAEGQATLIAFPPDLFK